MLLALLLSQADTVDLTTLDLAAIQQGWGSPQKNKSVDGNPLRVNGSTYQVGIGTHAVSEFEIALAGKALSFKTLCALDDEAGPKGTVAFQLYVDGKKVAETPTMKLNDGPEPLEADLKGAKTLKLVVTDGGDNIDYDHADWIAPVITTVSGGAKSIKAKVAPKEPPMPIASGIRDKPRINGARVIGCTPGKPFLFKIAASGKRPFKFEIVEQGFRNRVESTPHGIKLDPSTGILSGEVERAGTYEFTVRVTGSKGQDTRPFTIVAGPDSLAQTPPMGWNSWNVWGTTVDADKVKASADALEKSGLADFGYQYVNIDDAWEGTRSQNGTIMTNEKFPDMKGLADYVHAKGMKLGIYSSPGPKTCAGYEGSYGHEVKDANRYAEWGIDYLKHDWCSYGTIAKDNSLPELQKPYHTMRDALRQAPRDIVYSLCQYGMGNVWKWGNEVGGNLWRTTGDITDTWNSMSEIGFRHSEYAEGAGPGGWNDPDMLVVGNLGWGPNPRPTRLTGNEQITHITLWSLLAAPLILGCDLTKLDKFTKDLLTNPEVIDVDQDPLGKAAKRVWKRDRLEVWARPLADGSIAVGLFNRDTEKAPITARWTDLGITGVKRVRDLWRRKDLGDHESRFTATIPAHGARLITVRAK